jgi:hypothetical protein
MHYCQYIAYKELQGDINGISILLYDSKNSVTWMSKALLGNDSVNGVTQATMEVQVFIARCWATSSAPMNSPARNHITCFLCCQRRDHCYAVIGAHISTIEAEFSVCGQHKGYITSSVQMQ